MEIWVWSPDCLSHLVHQLVQPDFNLSSEDAVVDKGNQLKQKLILKKYIFLYFLILKIYFTLDSTSPSLATIVWATFTNFPSSSSIFSFAILHSAHIKGRLCEVLNEVLHLSNSLVRCFATFGGLFPLERISSRSADEAK